MNSPYGIVIGPSKVHSISLIVRVRIGIGIGLGVKVDNGVDVVVGVQAACVIATAVWMALGLGAQAASSMIVVIRRITFWNINPYFMPSSFWFVKAVLWAGSFARQAAFSLRSGASSVSHLLSLPPVQSSGGFSLFPILLFVGTGQKDSIVGFNGIASKAAFLS
jgi:hypothetical protein